MCLHHMPPFSGEPLDLWIRIFHLLKIMEKDGDVLTYSKSVWQTMRRWLTGADEGPKVKDALAERYKICKSQFEFQANRNG